MNILNYFIEANIGLLVFLGLYGLLLKRETNFRLVRLVMLGGIFLSLLLPLIHFQNTSSSVRIPSIGNIIPSYWLSEISITPDQSTVQENQRFGLQQLLFIIYVIGTQIFFWLFIAQLLQLVKVLRHSHFYKRDGFHIIESVKANLSFSFFNFIIIGNAGILSESEKQHIINHESVHARQWHSIDVLLLNILTIFFWFNPFIFNYKRIFLQLHEFEADTLAVENADSDKYCSLLAKVALQSAGFSMASHFNSSLTVKRIEMIRTIKTKVKGWKLVAISSIILFVFVIISCQDQVLEEYNPILPSAEKTNGKEPDASITEVDKIYTMAEQQPEFRGAYPAMTDYIHKNLKYPKEARVKRIEGTVYVSFVVRKDGTISEAKVLRGIDPFCDEEALKVVKSLPAWKPGTQDGKPVSVRFVLPIKFRLTSVN
jgi:TonB family protein